MRTVSFVGRLCNQLMVVVVPTSSGELGALGLIDGVTRVNDVSLNVVWLWALRAVTRTRIGNADRLVGVQAHSVAVGGNPEAARIAGVKVPWIVFSVYVITGICAAIAAILVSGRLASASPIIGNLYELDAIAAVVIGGSALQGGRATIVGTFLGVITFALIFNLLTLMNLAVEIQQITKGLIILAAVLVQRKER